MIYEIKNENVTAKIDSLGAQLKSYIDVLGAEYIYQPLENYWQGQAPILFPIVGGLKDGKTIIDDKEYFMGRHGIARNSEFEVVMHTKSSIVFSLKYNESTLEKYPFKFCFNVSYILDGTALINKFDVVNLDDKDIYFTLGGHPAFKCPIENNDKFENHVVEFECPETLNCPQICNDGTINLENRTLILENNNKLELNRPMFDNDALVFDELKSRKVKLYSKATGRGVSMDFTGFDFFALWTQPKTDAPFVCLEPWLGMADCNGETGLLKDKRGMKTLKPQESFSVSFKIDQI